VSRRAVVAAGGAVTVLLIVALQVVDDPGGDEKSSPQPTEPLEILGPDTVPTVPPPPKTVAARPEVVIGDLNNISFVDPDHGFATTHSGRRIAITSDGGRTWSDHGAVFLPEDPSLQFGVEFSGPQDGVVFGKGHRYVTSDGGATWTERPADGDPIAVVASGGSLWTLSGIACVEFRCEAAVEASDDGGRSWRRLEARPALSVGNGTELVRVDPQTGYVTGGRHIEGLQYEPAIAVTRDAGRSWSLLKDPCPSRSVVDAAGAELWLVCAGTAATVMESHYVFRSSDGGVTWNLVAAAPLGPNEPPSLGSIPASGHISQVIAVSGSRAWLALSRNGLFVSNDGGTTWESALPDDYYDGVGPLDELDEQHAWVMVHFTLWRTTDGVTWEHLGGELGSPGAPVD